MSEENKNELTIEEEEVNIPDSSNDSNNLEDLPLVAIDNKDDKSSTSDILSVSYTHLRAHET